MPLDCPLVLIEWLDSRRPISEWRFLGDAPDQGPVRCASVGWLLRDGEMKVLCQTIGDADEDDPQGMGMIQIPACAVVSVSYLTERPPQGREGPPASQAKPWPGRLTA